MIGIYLDARSVARETDLHLPVSKGNRWKAGAGVNRRERDAEEILDVKIG